MSITMMEAPPKAEVEHLHVSHEEYGKLGERLAVKIYQSEWEFDQILCIARGGMFIGDQLSRIFDIPLAVTSARSYDGKKQGALSISTTIAMNTPALGKRILLVDDLVDSGVTLAAILESVVTNNPDVEVRTAVIWRKTCSQFTPDYFVEESPENTWILQPFEGYERVSIKDLVQQYS